MKTNKVNPLTAFRKLTEARQAKVKKSLKKAQDGIQTNGDAMDMINKSGSTGGYKAPSPSSNSNSAAYKALADGVAQRPYNISEPNLTNSMMENASMANERARIGNAPGAKSAALNLYLNQNAQHKIDAMNNLESTNKAKFWNQKKGGIVKRKK